jgi:hypothetical protein
MIIKTIKSAKRSQASLKSGLKAILPVAKPIYHWFEYTSKK